MSYSGCLTSRGSSFWQRINGMAQVRSAKLAEVDLDYVLGVGGFDLERLVHDCINYFVSVV